jgi:NitT/TauT family transport system substrate-binding protein
MRRVGHHWTGLLATAVALYLVAGPAAHAADPVIWRHGLIEAKSDAGILLMVTRHDFAAKQGLKLEVTQFKSDIQELQALLAGELDSIEGGVGGTISAASHGTEPRILGCHWPILPHGIFTKNSVASIADLKGKTFAISSPGAMPDLMVHAVLAKYNIAPGDVRFANLGSDLDRYKALSAGVVDAAVVSGEYVPIAAKEGIKLLIAGHDAMPDFIRLCMVTTAAVVAQKHDAAVGFVTAEMNALHYALAHKDETLALTRELTDGKADDPRPGYIFDQAKNGAVDPLLSIPMDKLDWMQQQMISTGSLPKPIDMAKYVAPEIRAAALARADK